MAYKNKAISYMLLIIFFNTFLLMNINLFNDWFSFNIVPSLYKSWFNYEQSFIF